MNKLIQEGVITMSNDFKYECRFAVHIPTTEEETTDYHYVKLIEHHPDGTTKPITKLIQDFKRKVWITKPKYRNHNQKKEYEELDKLKEYNCTQSELANTIAKAINHFGRIDLRELKGNEFVYGADISSTALIKSTYKAKYPDVATEYTFGIYDVETNVLSKENEVIIATYVQDNYIFSAMTQEYYNRIPRSQADLIDEIMSKLKVSLDENMIVKTDYIIDIVVKKDSYEVVKYCFDAMHKLKPDIVSGWNIHFDIDKSIEACEVAGIDPKDVFCDRDIPKHLRLFNKQKGLTIKKTVSGKEKPLPAHEQWHTYELTAPFAIIDQMSLFKLMRLGEQERPSYKLEAISHHYLGSGKVYVDEAEKYEGLSKHVFMQKYHTLYYFIYNVFDCVRCRELELHPLIGDLRFKVDAFSGVSDFKVLNSQPKRIADEMHFDYLEAGVVIASVGKSKKSKTYQPYDDEDIEIVEDDFDETDLSKSLGLGGWVMTLPSHNVSVNVGLRLIEEDYNHRTNIRGLSYDIDATTAYPKATMATNNSRATTWTELLEVDGVDEEVFRLQNINIVSSSVNSIEYAVTMFNFPEPIDVLKEFMNDH